MLENRSLNALKIFLLAVLALVAGTIFIGIPILQAHSMCQVTVKKCHGVPLDGCIGYTSTDTSIVEQDNCEHVEEIQSRCNSVAEKICEANEQKIGTEWAERSKVSGQSCAEWRQKYSLNLTSC